MDAMINFPMSLMFRGLTSSAYELIYVGTVATLEEVLLGFLPAVLCGFPTKLFESDSGIPK